MKDDYLIALGEWSDSLHCPTWARNPGGVPLGLVSFEKNLAFRREHIYIYIYFFFFSLHSFSTMIFVNLTMIFLDTFADKDHVSPKLSHTNVQALNYLLRSEIFVSEDGQL